MFDNKVYMTSGVAHEVPEVVQLSILALIIQLKATSRNMDYLQVFKVNFRLHGANYEITIEHYQEIDDYKNQMIVKSKDSFVGTIYCISDEDENREEYCTMLLASEY